MTTGLHWLSKATFVMGVALLSACTLSVPTLPRLGASDPVVAPPAPRPAAPVPPSAESEKVRAYFAQVQTDLMSRGLMRRETAPVDAPFDSRRLAENFIRIALYDEYATQNGRLVASETPSRLRRWQAPIRVGLRFGDSVSDSKRAKDTADLTRYITELSQITGHPMRVSDQYPNYWVYIVSEDERPLMAQTWAQHFPGLSPHDVAIATQMGLETFCMVLAISDGNSPVYSGALAVIRSELPPEMTYSCLQEELAQGLGLANDFSMARPSIFNDDEEFSDLTAHDALLLQILYDRRLKPGMRESEAAPIIHDIAQRLLDGES